MYPLEKRIGILQNDVALAIDRLQIVAKTRELHVLDSELAEPEIWNNPTHAQEVSKAAASLRAQTEPWQTLKIQVDDIAELMAMGDDSMQAELEAQLDMLESEFAERKKELLYSGEFDDHNAILRITAGTGGTDAQDWAEMLERMYLRWAEKSEMKTISVERSTGEEAGIKTSVIEVEGVYAYGKLKSEHGVHRLVRLSPFNSDNLRQTSFALVEVLPSSSQYKTSAVSYKIKKLPLKSYVQNLRSLSSSNTPKNLAISRRAKALTGVLRSVTMSCILTHL